MERDEKIMLRRLNELCYDRSPLTLNMKQASELLGVTYRTIRYYKELYSEEVYQQGRDIELSSVFIQKVRDKLANDSNKEPKPTVDELISRLDEVTESRDRLMKSNKMLKNRIEEFISKNKV